MAKGKKPERIEGSLFKFGREIPVPKNELKASKPKPPKNDDKK